MTRRVYAIKAICFGQLSATQGDIKNAAGLILDRTFRSRQVENTSMAVIVMMPWKMRDAAVKLRFGYAIALLGTLVRPGGSTVFLTRQLRFA